MNHTRPACWQLDDLAGPGDLAAEYGITRATVCNWQSRYPDFPAPLISLSSGPVFSRRQVRRWHDGRTWLPGKHGRAAAG